MRSIEWWHCRWPWVPPNHLKPPHLLHFALPFVAGEPRDFKFSTLAYHSTSHPAEEKSSLKGAWSGSRKQFLHCGLRKFRHSKSSIYRWYTQLDRRRFVYDTLPPTKPPTSHRRFGQDFSYKYFLHCCVVIGKITIDNTHRAVTRR